MFSSVHSIWPGVITAFAGNLGNIPPGWFLCDGTNGTPDLRDKFIPATGPIFSVGDEAGSVNHNHDFTGDGHTHVQDTVNVIDRGAGYRFAPTTDPATGTTDPKNNLPNYYALAYIQYQGA